MAFTLKDVLFTVQDLYQNKTSRRLNSEMFNRYLQLANNEEKRIVYGKVGEKEGYETEQQIIDALHPFIKQETISLTNGVGKLPTDYWHKAGMVLTDGTKVDFVSHQEAERRNNDSIDTPSLTYPIVELLATTFQVYPDEVTSVIFTYLKYDYPEIAYLISGENDIPNYSEDDSTELLWGDDHIINIIRIILGYLNIPMDNAQVLQYLEAKNLDK